MSLTGSRLPFSGGTGTSKISSSVACPLSILCIAISAKDASVSFRKAPPHTVHIAHGQANLLDISLCSLAAHMLSDRLILYLVRIPSIKSPHRRKSSAEYFLRTINFTCKQHKIISELRCAHCYRECKTWVGRKIPNCSHTKWPKRVHTKYTKKWAMCLRCRAMCVRRIHKDLLSSPYVPSAIFEVSAPNAQLQRAEINIIE